MIKFIVSKRLRN